MTDEELATLIKAGNTERIPELWAKVEGFIRSRAAKLLGDCQCRNGCTIEDLLHSSYPAFIKAIEYFDPDNEKGGSFLKALSFFLPKSFTAALGQNSRHVDSVLDQAVSLDLRVNQYDDEDDSTLLDFIADDSAVQSFFKRENAVIHENVCNVLYPILDSLSIPQQDVIYARYWLGLTCAEIGQLYGVSRQRIHQIEQSALESIRSHPETSCLKDSGIFDG